MVEGMKNEQKTVRVEGEGGLVEGVMGRRQERERGEGGED